VKDSADRLRQITDQFGTILADLGENGPSIKVDAAGLLADRATYDGRSAGFAYYATDTELLYIKLGGAADAWSLGAPVAVGPVGPMGDVTPEALDALQSAQAAASASADSAEAAEQHRLAAQLAADAVSAIGAGWTPVLAVVADGERRVLQVTDWTGGEANKPAVGQYVGPSGFVASIGDASDVRGAAGAGTVESVSGVLPDSNGNVDLGPEDVGALPANATATDSSKLGGRAAADYEALYGRAGTAGALGFRNKIINGNMRINQRGFNGTWTGLAEGAYGFDRWKRSGTNIQQVIEEGNFKPNTVHTLSGTGVTTQQITSPASGHWTITVPNTATNVQVEEGTVATPFEHRPYGVEYELCRRFTRVKSGLGILSGATQETAGQFPIDIDGMRAIPTLKAGIGTQDAVYRYGAGTGAIGVTARSIWQSSASHLLLKFETGVALGVYPAVVDINTPLILDSEL